MEKPYIISGELDLANNNLEAIINKQNLESFREELDDSLQSMGKNTVWVGSDGLKTGLNKILGVTALPIVSLDDRYISNADIYLGISRGVDRGLNDVGYVPRAGYGAISEQLASIESGQEIILVDDVVFGGDMVSWLVQELGNRDIKVGAVACGIAIGDGVEKMNNLGLKIEAVRYFEDVDDEICERDFAVVPGSGRRIDELNTNALYFDPQFGNPVGWASLPESIVRPFAVQNYLRMARLINNDVSSDITGSFYGLSVGNVKESLLAAAERNGN